MIEFDPTNGLGDGNDQISQAGIPANLKKPFNALIATLDMVANPEDPEPILAERNFRFRNSFLWLMEIANQEAIPETLEEEVFKKKGPILGCEDLGRFETSDFLGVWGRNYGNFDRLEALLRYGSPRTRLIDHSNLSSLIYDLHMENLR